MQFLLTRPKVTIPKQYKKVKSFFLNKCYLDCQQNIVYIYFNVNQIGQLFLSNNEASHHHIYVNNTHREKLRFTQSNTRIY